MYIYFILFLYVTHLTYISKHQFRVHTQMLIIVKFVPILNEIISACSYMDNYILFLSARVTEQ